MFDYRRPASLCHVETAVMTHHTLSPISLCYSHSSSYSLARSILIHRARLNILVKKYYFSFFCINTTHFKSTRHESTVLDVFHPTRCIFMLEMESFGKLKIKYIHRIRGYIIYWLVFLPF